MTKPTALPSDHGGQQAPTSFVAHMRDMIRHVDECSVLTQEMMWSRQGPVIWKAKSFSGYPHFYPVYRHKEFYSYSPLPLILLKGRLSLNPRFVRLASLPNCPYYPREDTIDREISRVGGPMRPTFLIKDTEQLVHAMAKVIQNDVSRIEESNPGFTNVVLCGGKDSLNLLLLSWKNPVLVASAAPNYELVKAFIADNGLAFNLIELVDEIDQPTFDAEVLANCCSSDLRHIRWGKHLRCLALQLNQRAVFWCGSLGDTYMTPYWRSYAFQAWNSRSLWNRAVYKLSQLVPKRLLDRYTMSRLHANEWRRGAMWQGVGHAIYRQITGCLVASAYHGKDVAGILSQLDLSSTINYDVRPHIGNLLLGRVVKYPMSNPGPPVSAIRTGLSSVGHFVEALSKVDVSVDGALS